MEHSTRFSPPAVGGSSLLAIFAVLTVSVFALLSLSTVLAEKRLSDSSAQAVSAYYAADLEAETIFAQLRGGQLPPQVEQSGDHYRFTCAISETQTLAVELRLTDGTWEVLRWQTIAQAQTSQDQTLPIWGGTTEGGTP